MTRLSRRCIYAALLAGSVLMLQACDDKIVAPEQPQIRSLEVFPNPATVRVDEDLVMVIKLAADSGADQSLTWQSSDPRRVSVTQSGIIRGIAVGPAVITVQSDADPTFASAIPVTVMPRYTGVSSVSASPFSVTLIPGQTQPIAATVTADPGVSRAVSYSSDNAAVATVSAGGVVTAVSVGSARLTVRSVVDTSAQTTVPITVRAPTGARVSIQAVTSRSTNLPVDLLNTQGQIDVLVNLEPGEARLSRLDLVVNNAGRDTVVATQSFTALQAAKVFATGVNGAISAGVVVQSFRTDAFDPGLGTAYFRNGPTTLKVIAVDITASGTTQQSATSSVVAVLNNPDGFMVQVRPLSTTGTTNALDPAGRRWFQAGRGLVVTTTPVIFSNRQLGARTISFPGNAPVGSVTSTGAGVSVDTLRLPAGFNTPNAGEGYLSGELPSVVAADLLGNSIAMVPALPSGSGAGIMNVQPTFTTGLRLEGIRVDNAPPPASTLIITASRGNSNNWINGAYTFAEGLQSLTQDGGVGLRGSAVNPTPQSAEVAFLAVGGELADTTEVFTGANLPATNSNLTYQLIARYADRLGNTRLVSLSGAGSHPGNRFGVDLLPPTLRYATGSLTGRTLISANSDSVFTSNSGAGGHRAFAVEAIDDRSGLPDGRVAVTVQRFAQPNPANTFTGTTTCVIGTGPTCTPVFRTYDTVLPNDYRQTSVLVDDSSGIEGYYQFTATAQDQAGNISAPRSKRALIDAGTGASAPSMSGLGLTRVLVGNEPAAFLALASDNVELRSGGVLVQYPNLPGSSQMLAYGTPFAGGTSLGVSFDSLLTSPIAGTHPAFTVPKFIRSMEVVDTLHRPPTGVGTTVKPNGANAWVTDFAFGGAPATMAVNSVIVPGAVESAPVSPVFAGNLGTIRELQTWRRAGESGLRFEAIGPSGQIAPPFTRVIIARLENTALSVNPEAWRVIGELGSPVGYDNGLRRVWSWDFGGLGSGSYIAIGVNAAGDGLMTRLVTP